MGNLPVELALTMAAVVLAALCVPCGGRAAGFRQLQLPPAAAAHARHCGRCRLPLMHAPRHLPLPAHSYAPVSKQLDSPLTQALLQQFSWTAADVPADLRRRNEQLEESAAGGRAARPMLPVRMLTYVPGKMKAGLAQVVHVQDLQAAARQLAQEPIFCLETGAWLGGRRRGPGCGGAARQQAAGSERRALPALALPPTASMPPSAPACPQRCDCCTGRGWRTEMTPSTTRTSACGLRCRCLS